jgi:hypothetical protein
VLSDESDVVNHRVSLEVEESGRYSPDLDTQHLSGSLLDLLASHRKSSTTSGNEPAADIPVPKTPVKRESTQSARVNSIQESTEQAKPAAGIPQSPRLDVKVQSPPAATDGQDSTGFAFKRNVRTGASFKATKSRFEVCVSVDFLTCFSKFPELRVNNSLSHCRLMMLLLKIPMFA